MRSSSPSAFMVHEIDKKVFTIGSRGNWQLCFRPQSCTCCGWFGWSIYFSFFNYLFFLSYGWFFNLHFDWKWRCVWSRVEIRWQDTLFDTAATIDSRVCSFIHEGVDFSDSFLWRVCSLGFIPWRHFQQRQQMLSLQPRKQHPRREPRRHLGKIVTAWVVKLGQILGTIAWREHPAWGATNQLLSAARWAEAMVWVTCQRCRLRLSYTPQHSEPMQWLAARDHCQQIHPRRWESWVRKQLTTPRWQTRPLPTVRQSPAWWSDWTMFVDWRIKPMQARTTATTSGPKINNSGAVPKEQEMSLTGAKKAPKRAELPAEEEEQQSWGMHAINSRPHAMRHGEQEMMLGVVAGRASWRRIDSKVQGRLSFWLPRFNQCDHWCEIGVWRLLQRRCGFLSLQHEGEVRWLGTFGCQWEFEETEHLDGSGSSEAQLADSLTKSAAQDMMRQFLQCGQLWVVKYDPGFVAAKRKKKLPSEDLEPCCANLSRLSPS